MIFGWNVNDAVLLSIDLRLKRKVSSGCMRASTCQEEAQS